MTGPAAELLTAIEARLPAGRHFAISGSDLASEVGISERMVRAIVEELIHLGVLVGSACSGERPGYFICVDEDDLEIGTAHLMSRARSMFARVSALRRAAAERFADPEVLRLFDLEEVSS